MTPFCTIEPWKSGPVSSNPKLINDRTRNQAPDSQTGRHPKGENGLSPAPGRKTPASGGSHLLALISASVLLSALLTARTRCENDLRRISPYPVEIHVVGYMAALGLCARNHVEMLLCGDGGSRRFEYRPIIKIPANQTRAGLIACPKGVALGSV